jgi:hypothetical protein
MMAMMAKPSPLCRPCTTRRIVVGSRSSSISA